MMLDLVVSIQMVDWLLSLLDDALDEDADSLDVNVTPNTVDLSAQ